MSQVIGVIPSRYGSTRFPGKPLAMIKGRPLLEWVVRGARESRLIDELIVATDDQRIEKLCREVDVRCVMTPSDIPTGTDRINEAIKGIKGDVIINIQGDEPLITGSVLDKLVQPMLNDPTLEMATLATNLEEADLSNPNTAKIVSDQRGRAIYFSRLPIPFSRSSELRHEIGLKHIGIYAYRRNFLERFCRQGPVQIELSEGLEQLRALYLGASIQVVSVHHKNCGVDTLEDISRVESLLDHGG